MVKTENHFVI